MADYIICNARIEGTLLGVDDHGILTFSLGLDYGDGSHQGFGGYAMDAPPPGRGCGSKRQPSVLCGAYIAGLLDAAGVEKWEDVRGRYVRVKIDADSGRVVAIGHIIKDTWFSPRDASSKHGQT
jgi:hypothetical protein